MADISKCKGGDCPKKQQCYRFTAPEDKYMQSYLVEIPYFIIMDNFSCDLFWNNEGYQTKEDIEFYGKK